VLRTSFADGQAIILLSSANDHWPGASRDQSVFDRRRRAVVIGRAVWMAMGRPSHVNIGDGSRFDLSPPRMHAAAFGFAGSNAFSVDV
jgi:hypothetical protein